MSKSKVPIPKETIGAYCLENGIQSLALLGSVLREDIHSGSDVDMLVDFGADSKIGYLGMMRIQRELSAILGRKVDLRTAAELSPYFRDRVLTESETLF